MFIFMRRNSPIENMNLCDAQLRGIAPVAISGRVASVAGLMAEVQGLTGHVFVGDQVLLHVREGTAVPAEVAGFRDGSALVLPFGGLDGLGPGQMASVAHRTAGTIA